MKIRIEKKKKSRMHVGGVKAHIDGFEFVYRVELGYVCHGEGVVVVGNKNAKYMTGALTTPVPGTHTLLV